MQSQAMTLLSKNYYTTYVMLLYFIRIGERQMLKVTKCIGVKSFVEALINMVCELKITSGSKENCVKIPW